MTSAIAVQPIASAILSLISAGVSPATAVCDGVGPTNPEQHCPYVVVYVDSGVSEGAPFVPNRESTGTVSVRAVGLNAEQARRGADMVRGALDGIYVTVDSIQVHVWSEQSLPTNRDDSLAPTVLFEQLTVFRWLATR